ncbi:F0F1 ATP synthase subunit I [Paroceanicella profunda]|uniref:ATP synthase protein I n=1 Tax=Paroceanicella profunda TaxID=2579971 RepID=A0A5B8FH75_9RHOB|nr:AtpZ/AtpI family protein [Paroceanicella profunda]QDL92091.1 F0F1 ATP synthase subunit I [Paroceanicella profunda]
MDDKSDQRLEKLEARIKAARRARKPASGGEGKGSYSGVELAWRMVIDLVCGVGVGCGIGYGIDALTGTLPAFMILFTILGFGAGVRVMMRSAAEYQAKLNAPETAQDDNAPDPAHEDDRASGGR